jgi:hypothetical protein
MNGCTNVELTSSRSAAPLVDQMWLKRNPTVQFAHTEVLVGLQRNADQARHRVLCLFRQRGGFGVRRLGTLTRCLRRRNAGQPSARNSAIARADCHRDPVMW